MKLFKLIDLAGQFLIYMLTIIFLVDAFINRHDLYGHPDEGFRIAIPYMLLGIWQPSSAIIHFLLQRHFLPVKWRARYWQSLLILLLFAVFSALFAPDLILGVMIISPFIAILYTMASFKELALLQDRKFIHLK